MRGNSIDVCGIHVGDVTPDVKYTITKDQIKEYALLSTDNNPLHVDEEFAKNSMFKGIIAHGTIPLAYMFQTVHEYFKVAWVKGLKYEVKFIAPVRPGDVVVCNGKVKNVNTGAGNIVIELYCQNQKNENVIVGEAIVPIQ
jgi:3-hydroxybutyryl-CoA dehydratase